MKYIISCSSSCMSEAEEIPYKEAVKYHHTWWDDCEEEEVSQDFWVVEINNLDDILKLVNSIGEISIWNDEKKGMYLLEILDTWR